MSMVFSPVLVVMISPSNADEIADVNELHELGECFAEFVFLRGELQLAGKIEQMAECEFSKTAHGDDPARDPYIARSIGQARSLFKRMGFFIPLGIRRQARLFYGFEFFYPDGPLICCFRCFQRRFLQKLKLNFDRKLQKILDLMA